MDKPGTLRTIGRTLGVLVVAASSLWAAERKTTNVPPWDEIEILDPNVDPLGRPKVTLRDEEGQTQVDIPPSVLVHKYYYSGDRSFQGPMLPGGPTVVVANHPRSGERCYVDAQLPPGAPRVTYTNRAIEYDFGNQTVSVEFPWLCKPRVRYVTGTPLATKLTRATKSVTSNTVESVRSSRLAEHTVSVAKGTWNAAGGIYNGACDLGERITAPVCAIVDSTPVGSLVHPDPGRKAMRERERELARVQRETRRSEASIPTIR